MLTQMSDDNRAAQLRTAFADRVDRGDFDAALRPTSNEGALREGPARHFALVAEVARAEFDPAERWDEFVQGCGSRLMPASV
jgi:hypothetical protein